VLHYFCVGAGAGDGVDGWAGAAGFDCVGEDFTPERTESPVEPEREARIESVIEVTMKMMADQVVALERAVAAPRGPKAVWLPWPPKAAAISPLLPLCSRTTTMRKKQTAMWMNVTR